MCVCHESVCDRLVAWPDASELSVGVDFTRGRQRGQAGPIELIFNRTPAGRFACSLFRIRATYRTGRRQSLACVSRP